jgi:hypothetical protein
MLTLTTNRLAIETQGLCRTTMLVVSRVWKAKGTHSSLIVYVNATSAEGLLRTLRVQATVHVQISQRLLMMVRRVTVLLHMYGLIRHERVP